MRRLPGGSDFDGWVATLAFARHARLAKHHLLTVGERAVPAVRRGLAHEDPVVRRACTNILDRLVDAESLADLVAALDDEDAGVRARALHALACDACKQNECRPGEDVWVPRALELLDHPDADLRAAAIDALGKVVDHRPEVADALAEVVEHDRLTGLRGMARRQLLRARPVSDPAR
jgi:HEAT repeat protein